MGSLWCFPLGGWLHFWQVWLITILQNCRILNLVSNLQFSYQTAASAATPLPLFRTGWTIFVAPGCAVWTSLRTRLFALSNFLCLSNPDHRFLTICAASTPFRLSLPFPTFHRFRLSLSSPLSRAYLSGRADSFVSSFQDGSSV